MSKRIITLVMLIVLCSMLVLPVTSEAALKNHSVVDLVGVISKLRTSSWTDMYAPNDFDCSNMSALLDFILDELGFESYIVQGKMLKRDATTGQLVPTSRNTCGHALLLVLCKDASGQLSVWWVETTGLFVYPATNTLDHWISSDTYFTAVHVYATAAQAYAAQPWEFAWTLDDVKRIANTVKQ